MLLADLRESTRDLLEMLLLDLEDLLELLIASPHEPLGTERLVGLSGFDQNLVVLDDLPDQLFPVQENSSHSRC